MIRYHFLTNMLFVFFLLLQFLGSNSILSTASSTSTQKVVLSCQSASMTDNSNSFCSLVDWQHAAAYLSANYTTYNSAKPLSSQEQGNYARTLFDLYHTYGNKVTSAACDDAMTRYACVSAYPPCPDTISSPASGYTYFPPCRTQCEVVKSVCQSNIDCSHLPQKNCALSLSTVNYALSIDQGPYNAEAILYPIIFTFWCVLGIIWIYFAFIKYRFNSVLLCKFLALIPFMKVVTLVFGVSFWVICVKQSMCTAWLAIAYQNIVLIFETGLCVNK